MCSFATFGATKLCSLCLGGSHFGTKVSGVLPLRMRHKAMQLVLGRLVGNNTEKGPFLVFFCYVLGTKLGAVLLLRMRQKAMQLVLGRLAGNKIEKSQFYQCFNSILFQFYNFIVERQK